MLTPNQIKKRVDVALGRIPADVVIQNTTYLDVFCCEWRHGDIAIVDGVIVGLESGLEAKRTIDGRGKWVVPGFIDAHVHIESSLVLPHAFERTTLPKGTTTAICDPHELTNVVGIAGIEYFLEASQNMHLDLRVMLSSCVPATNLETNGGGTVTARDLQPLMSHPRSLGLAEMMNIHGVLNGDEIVLDKLALFSERAIDGHAPLVTGRNLSAYAAAGMSSCHESTRPDEALEKLTKGLSVWIREGSVAKDLDALAPLINAARSPCLGFCTDDRNPLDIALEGHIDFLIRGAIRKGVPAEVAYRCASWSVAKHYGLKGKGAVAPGYEADLVILSDMQTCAVETVLRRGHLVSELEFAPESKVRFRNTVRATVPELLELEGPKGRVHVINVTHGSLITEGTVENHDDLGIAKLTVLERYGHGRKPSNAYVKGFGQNFRGAVAASVAHDSHNLIVVGSDTLSMRTALATLIASGGGFCVTKDDAVLAHLSLPVGGLMSDQSPSYVADRLRELRSASHSVGCILPEPFLQLAFLSLPVIPDLKLTDHGLVDVRAGKIISVVL